MRLSLYRQAESAISTQGELFCDGRHAAWTMEPPSPRRIPAGTYKVTIYNSPHFGRPMPLLENTPGCPYCEIHPGNVPGASHCCILVGKQKGQDTLLYTREAFDSLFPAIAQAVGAEGCEITVYDPPGRPADLSLQGDT